MRAGKQHRAAKKAPQPNTLKGNGSGNAGQQQTDDLEQLRQRIARRAYELYEQRGGTAGSELNDWLQAKQEILIGS